MEVAVLEQSKKKIIFLIKGEDHTFCNALREELTTDSDVNVAAYRIEHPLTAEPKFIVETKSGDAKKAVLDGVKRLQKNFEIVKKAA
jgi:DNA-directed RNA polymerase subunit L